jgi:protein-S-isoprenylcysteine O-methyltransferase Ste14
MLWLLLGTGLILTPFPLLTAAMLIFIAGTEIRVRIEEKLLSERFGDQFREYQESTGAYIPFL